jgi:hypothetical protein
MIKTSIFLLLSFGVLSLFCACTDHDDVIITIDDLTVEQRFPLPFRSQKGWITKSTYILENTANDTIEWGMNLVPPGGTGLMYVQDEYNSEPDTFFYRPGKATKGKLVIRFRVIKAD